MTKSKRNLFFFKLYNEFSKRILIFQDSEKCALPPLNWDFRIISQSCILLFTKKLFLLLHHLCHPPPLPRLPQARVHLCINVNTIWNHLVWLKVKRLHLNLWLNVSLKQQEVNMKLGLRSWINSFSSILADQWESLLILGSKGIFWHSCQLKIP